MHRDVHVWHTVNYILIYVCVVLCAQAWVKPQDEITVSKFLTENNIGGQAPAGAGPLSLEQLKQLLRNHMLTKPGLSAEDRNEFMEIIEDEHDSDALLEICGDEGIDVTSAAAGAAAAASASAHRPNSAVAPVVNDVAIFRKFSVSNTHYTRLPVRHALHMYVCMYVCMYVWHIYLTGKGVCT